MGAMAVLLFKSSSVAIVLFIVPMAYVIYRSFGNYLARTEERQLHIEQLQAKQHDGSPS